MRLQDKIIMTRLLRPTCLVLLGGMMLLAGLQGPAGAAPALDGYEDARQTMTIIDLQ